MNESTPQSERPPPLSRLRAGLMVGVGAVALACLVFGSLPVKVVAVVLAVCVIQGLWRGAAELVGLVIGMVLGQTPPAAFAETTPSPAILLPAAHGHGRK